MLPDAMPVMMHLRNVRREHYEAVKMSLMVFACSFEVEEIIILIL